MELQEFLSEHFCYSGFWRGNMFILRTPDGVFKNCGNLSDLCFYINEYEIANGGLEINEWEHSRLLCMWKSHFE